MSNRTGLSDEKPAAVHNRLITLSDLEDFKNQLKAELKVELLQALKLLLSDFQKPLAKKWLKSYEVKKLLNLSHGTLQTLRDNGVLPFSKIGGIFYYDQADIEKELERRKSLGRNRSGQFIPIKR